MAKLKDAIKLIQNWLKKTVGSAFKVTGDSLAHGNQEDVTNCGILAANTAAHEVFGDPLWSPSKKILACATWFVQMCSLHIDDVRTPGIFSLSFD